jgi:superfamily II DNA or RNA helicase
VDYTHRCSLSDDAARSRAANIDARSDTLSGMHHRGRGLYEVLITEALQAELLTLSEPLEPRRSPLRPAEAADRIALHIGRVIERAIESLDEPERARVGASLARRLVDLIGESVGQNDLAPERPLASSEVLRALLGRLPDGRAETITEPLIPLLDTTLLTNAPGEPRVGSQIVEEIRSADRIDAVLAFIRHSGITPMLDALKAHCSAGRQLRILTTTYTGSTEGRALDALRDLGANVRVSYDTSGTRLHAKAWLFHRESGFSTAYIGSSNLTHSAQVSGLEWNVRVSKARNAPVVDKVAAVFESYWKSPDFFAYDADQFLEQTQNERHGSELLLSPIELRAEPFQERLLEQIALSRLQGHHRNLLVSATGTGKTVMATLDYARLRETLPRARLLFVAHRAEILEKTLATFRYALRDATFGELWVGGQRPKTFEHVFASIQSLHADALKHLAPDHFDIVIVDEFHHAAASSYAHLLEHVKPIELLGLTATPERSDGLPILNLFDGRIAAELRLWDAIDQHRLVPFAYYGIHDGLDLRDVPWKRGRGYDVDALSNLMTSDDAWARLVVKEVANRAEDVTRMRALGFCVSVEHARFMARVFSEAGIASTAIWSDTPDAERRRALTDLAARKVSVVFSVDIFNEGVDVPNVDTLLMLRPTESPTLFLQQLGRGLRKSTAKSLCTVLDFVGHHRKEFRFDLKLRALLGGSRNDVAAQVESGFPFLPAGCHMELDRVASEIVLASIRDATPSQWSAKVAELRALAKGANDYPLALYLKESGLELEDVYAGNKSWSDLHAAAGLTTIPAGPNEETLRRTCGRLLHIDDPERIEVYGRLLKNEVPPNVERLSVREQRLLRMLVATLVSKAAKKGAMLHEGVAIVWDHPQVRAEICELLAYLAERITHVAPPLADRSEVPLRVHARYTRVEILAAFGVGEGAKVHSWQTGVHWAEEARADLLAFTLDKTSGQFSPTTRYKDYAINDELIHWESQSVTRANGETGLRYQQHEKRGSSVMLFARLRSNERALYFLGPATYVEHTGELPMAITWKLEHRLPGDLFTAFAAAVA